MKISREAIQLIVKRYAEAERHDGSGAKAAYAAFKELYNTNSMDAETFVHYCRAETMIILAIAMAYTEGRKDGRDEILHPENWLGDDDVTE